VNNGLRCGCGPEIVDHLSGGYTGCVAVCRAGPRSVVRTQVDIDALPVTESEDRPRPPPPRFRSERRHMHACGHDAHATMRLGALDAVLDSISGTLRCSSSRAKKQVAGGKPMAESGHLDDVDYLYAVHVGGLDLR